MDDDDDPYGAGPSIDKRHYAFDQDEEDDVIVMGGPAKSSTGQKAQTGGPDRWHDGKPVLVGFVMDPKGVPEDKWWVIHLQTISDSTGLPSPTFHPIGNRVLPVSGGRQRTLRSLRTFAVHQGVHLHTNR